MLPLVLLIMLCSLVFAQNMITLVVNKGGRSYVICSIFRFTFTYLLTKYILARGTHALVVTVVFGLEVCATGIYQ